MQHKLQQFSGSLLARVLCRLSRTATCCLEALHSHTGSLWLPASQPSGCDTLSSDMLAVAGRANGREADGSEANGVEAGADAAAAGAEGLSTAAEGGEQSDHRPTLQQTKTQGSGALGNSAARNVVAGVVDEATGGMNAGQQSRLCAEASPLKVLQSALGCSSGHGSQQPASAARAWLQPGTVMLSSK